MKKAEHEREEWRANFAEFSWKGGVEAPQNDESKRSHSCGAAQAEIPKQKALEECGTPQSSWTATARQSLCKIKIPYSLSW